MTDAEKLVACLREIGFEAQVRPVDYNQDFRGLATPKAIRQRVELGCHFLFDDEGKLAGIESEYDGWVSSVSDSNIAILGYRTAHIEGIGRRVVAIDLQFSDATQARKVLGLTEYCDSMVGRKVYVLPSRPEVRNDGVIHTLRFRHAAK